MNFIHFVRKKRLIYKNNYMKKSKILPQYEIKLYICTKFQFKE